MTPLQADLLVSSKTKFAGNFLKVLILDFTKRVFGKDWHFATFSRNLTFFVNFHFENVNF